MNSEPLTEPTYDAAHPLSEGRALVCCEDKWGYIDNNGTEVITCQHVPIWTDTCFAGICFSMAGNEGNMKHYFIDKITRRAFERSPPLLTQFSAGRAGIYDLETDTMGYINTDGDRVIEPKFKESSRFPENNAAITSLSKRLCSDINTTGTSLFLALS
ncbi:hypothetical protein MNBD_GAMMA09-1139 [hydrothermal vent metagenome]|uniref:WG repeat-containing protein n=1 Tax=hydrothermal vent metagenome TaxID=652676 RepID=A0A3B0X808_9ZZZZ